MAVIAIVAALALRPAVRLLALLPLDPVRRGALWLLRSRVLIIIHAVLVGAVVWSVDRMPVAPCEDRVQVCRDYLWLISTASVVYRADHDGRLASRLEDLGAYFKTGFFLPPVIPGDSFEFMHPPGTHLYVYQPVYVYQPAALDSRHAVLCYDAYPHRICHTLFFFLDQRVRNVVYGDRKVRTMSERQFQALGLPPAPESQRPAMPRLPR